MRGAGRADVVAAAQGWIGTPYVHQAAARQAGTDCLGLILGIWREVVGPIPETVPAYTRDWAEPAGIEALFAAAGRHLTRLAPGEDRAGGDVLLFRMRAGSVAKHLGIVSRAGPLTRFIHAYEGHGVVENSLSTPWARRIAGCFRFPERID